MRGDRISKHVILALSAAVGLFAQSVTTLCPACDVNGDGNIDQVDLQIAVNQALGILPCGSADVNMDGNCDLFDTMLIAKMGHIEAFGAYNFPFGVPQPAPLPSWPAMSDTDRSERFIDPQTGLLIRHLTLPGDQVWGTGPPPQFIQGFYTGTTEYCWPQPTTDTKGKTGYRCIFAGKLFFIASQDGEVTPLGMVVTSQDGEDGWWGNPCTTDSLIYSISDPNVWYGLCYAFDARGDGFSTRNAIIKIRYVGNNEPVPATVVLPQCNSTLQNQPCLTWTNITPGKTGRDLLSLQTQFDPAFTIPCLAYSRTGIGNHILMNCPIGFAESYGWTAVFDPDSLTFVGAVADWQNTPSRWCGIHASGSELGTDGISIDGHSLTGGNWYGRGPYQVILSGNIDDSSTIITVSGKPLNPNSLPEPDGSPEPSYLQDAQVGDVASFGLSENLRDNEFVKITGIQGNTWTIQRGFNLSVASAHAAGSALAMQCWSQDPVPSSEQSLWLWEYQIDPHGKQMRILAGNTGGHGSYSNETELAIANHYGSFNPPVDYRSFYQIRKGPPPNFLSAQPNYLLIYPGENTTANPGSTQGHPSQTFEGKWFLDCHPNTDPTSASPGRGCWQVFFAGGDDKTGVNSRFLTHGSAAVPLNQQNIYWNPRFLPDGSWMFYQAPYGYGQLYLAKIPQ